MTRPVPRWLQPEVWLPFTALRGERGGWQVEQETKPQWPRRDRRTVHVPRRLRVLHDYQRNADALGRPVLESARVVPLRPLFPHRRAVSNGMAHESLAWRSRTAAHRVVLR